MGFLSGSLTIPRSWGLRRGLPPPGDVVAAINSWDLPHGGFIEVGGPDGVFLAAHLAVGLAVGVPIR